MSRRVGLPLVVTLKVAVIGLTALGAFGGLERFEEKGFGWRLLWYPTAVLALPVLWRALKKRGPYPYLADALITFPFFVDVMGNVLNLYDTIDWWDDVNHFANWLFLSLGLGVLVINAVLFLLVPYFVRGFHVDGFIPALLGSVIVSLTNLVMTQLLRDKKGGQIGRAHV